MISTVYFLPSGGIWITQHFTQAKEHRIQYVVWLIKTNLPIEGETLGEIAVYVKSISVHD